MKPRSLQSVFLAAGAVVAVALVRAPIARAATPDPPQTRRHHPDHVVPDHSFADVERWTKVFDDPARDEWQKPEQVVAALRLGPGAVVADVGAGTGYFTFRLARAVAPGGRILAIDTEANMVEHLRGRAESEGVAGVEPILATRSDPRIGPATVDRILLVDTYHHIHDRVVYLRQLRAALRDGGEVAVVDFHKRPLPVGPPPEHKMDREEVLAEFLAAGYGLVREETFLPYQYYLIFAPPPGRD